MPATTDNRVLETNTQRLCPSQALEPLSAHCGQGKEVNKMNTKITLIVSFLILFIFGSGSQIYAMESTKESKFYLKGGIGGGGLEEDIPLKMWATTGEECKVESYTGLHLNFDMGYNIMPDLGVEVGLGWHKNTIGVEITGGDGYFKRVPLTVSGVYHFFKNDPFNVYGGLGIGYYMSPELYREGLGNNTTVKYEDASGYHGLIGGSWGTEKWFFFIDTKYAFGVKYKFKEGIENGIRYTAPQVFNEWREIDGSGILFNFGVGYRFNAGREKVSTPEGKTIGLPLEKPTETFTPTDKDVSATEKSISTSEPLTITSREDGLNYEHRLAPNIEYPTLNVYGNVVVWKLGFKGIRWTPTTFVVTLYCPDGSVFLQKVFKTKRWNNTEAEVKLELSNNQALSRYGAWRLEVNCDGILLDQRHFNLK